MNLDLGVLRSALNANKLSVAHLQGKLPVGVGGIVTAAAEGGGAWGLVGMEKEGLGRQDGIRSAIGSTIWHRTKTLEVGLRLCLRSHGGCNMLNVSVCIYLSLCLLLLLFSILRPFNESFVSFFLSVTLFPSSLLRGLLTVHSHF